ncbi:MAG: 6,7-dimethyl-8-ribityllumazine synthase [Burkholderiaceae bacterium]|nr:6,7-dimethyl-8-ribityllumazine synthase [Burkholderiaceae bacterium]
MSVDIIRGDHRGVDLRVGIVQARFNAEICDGLRDACVAELLALGVAESDMLLCSVPGALEIPTALLQLGRSGEFDVLIALGAVVKGDTYHFEVVSNESASGVSRVALELGIPVANAILTTYTEEQAHARASEKGAEAARVAVEMANLAAAIESLGEDPS